MKIPSALTIAILVSACSTCRGSSIQVKTPTSVVLRGYGPVSVEAGRGKTVFTCQDTAHADILLGKLLADLFWNSGQQAKEIKADIAGVAAVIHEYQPYGAIIAFRTGRNVVVLGDSDAAKLEVSAASDLSLRGTDVRFAPATAYPAYLDAYDLHNVRFHDIPMRTLNKAPLQSQWDFEKKFGGGGMQFTEPGFWSECPAPGVTDWATVDYGLGQAKRNQSYLTLEPNIEGWMPLWYYNNTAFQRAMPSPSILIDAWNNGGAGPAGTTYEGFGLTEAQKEQGPYWFLREVVERYRQDPNLIAWMPLGGFPGGEFGFHDRATGFFDYSPGGQGAFRGWLVHDRGMTLASLGLRWYGDERHFTDWLQVTLPDVNSFFGDPFAPDSIKLNGVWQWQPTAAQTPTPASEPQPPTLDGAKWVPYNTVPSQEAALLPHGHAYYRKQFELSEAEVKQAKFLVVDAYVHSTKPLTVWLNGAFLHQQKLAPWLPEAAKYEQFSVQVAGKLKQGQNELLFDVPPHDGDNSEGRILGTVFFTPRKPERYPNLGPHENARYVDLKDWETHGYYQLTSGTFKQFRSLDPNRPEILSGDDYFNLGDYEGMLAVNYGLALQNTGREAGYSSRPSGHGIVDGFYNSSEESSTASSPAALQQELGWMLFDADAQHVFYYRIDDNMKIEASTGWFSKNANLLRLIGKAMRERPDVLLLLDPETSRLGFTDPQQSDIAMGALEQMHLDSGCLTPWDLSHGFGEGYPVMFDCGTRVMDQPLLDSITKYVEAGGTYVACADTGRNSPLVPDAWPISQLTGFRIRSTDEKGSVTFANNLPVAAPLAGIKFPSADGAGDSLEAALPGVQTLATWQDGTIAVGFRQFGRGRIIVIGMHDLPKSGFALNQPAPGGGVASERIEGILLESLGVNRTSFCATLNIWTRKLVAKNGLDDWLVAFNSQNSAATADVEIKVDKKPEIVTDLETGAKVEFSYTDDGWVRIHSVSFGPLGTHVFGVSRGTLLDGIQTWWQEKTRYWQEKTSPVPHDFPSPAPGTISIKDWRFSTDEDGRLASDANTRLQTFDDTKWKPMRSAPWKDLSPELTQFKGNTYYRSAFTIPQDWDGHEIELNMYSWDTPIVFGDAQFAIDGKPFAKYSPIFGTSQTLNYDVTAMAKPGPHVLSVSVTHRSDLDDVSGAFIAGAIWLSPSPRFVEHVDLNGNWDAVGDDWVSVQPIVIPGKGVAKYIRKSFAAPADWKEKPVFIMIDAPIPFATLVINGTLIDKNLYLHQMGSSTLLNLSPYIHAGGDNVIELWPAKSAQNRNNTPDGQHGNVQVSQIQLGVLDSRDLPVKQ